MSNLTEQIQADLEKERSELELKIRREILEELKAQLPPDVLAKLEENT